MISYYSGWHTHQKHQLLFAKEEGLTIEAKHSHYIVPPTCATWIPADMKHETAHEALRLFAHDYCSKTRFCQQCIYYASFYSISTKHGTFFKSQGEVENINWSIQTNLTRCSVCYLILPFVESYSSRCKIFENVLSCIETNSLLLMVLKIRSTNGLSQDLRTGL